ncbi:MAG: hypothetical protein AAFO93_09150 [Pseudomonadota bacterium]
MADHTTNPTKDTVRRPKSKLGSKRSVAQYFHDYPVSVSPWR